MGGFGSGQSTGRATIGGAQALDLARLRATGRSWGSWGWSLAGEPMGSISWALNADALVLRFSRQLDDGTWRQFEDRLPIVTTHPHFGGERQWLRCPCGRRCRVVYVQRAGARCRRCYRLSYQSQREDSRTRGLRMAERIVRRLGGREGDDIPDKPKSMHWTTYWRLVERYYELENRGFAEVAGLLLKPG